LAVEERFETLVHDTGSLLASAGGNLGLMLGFSCLSVLTAALDCLRDYFEKYYHNNKT